MQLMFVGLALICFLEAETASIPVSDFSSGVQDSSTPNPVLPTDTQNATNTTDDGDNSIIPVLQITDYHYFDWPKIGYQIFMQKMISALNSLKFFLSLDPMLVKITRTYFLTNDTNLDYGDSNSTDDGTEYQDDTLINLNNDSNEIPTQENQSAETNTESPLKVALYGSEQNHVTDTSPITDTSAPSIESNSNDLPKESKDDGEKEETKTGGFFSSIAGSVTSFFHDLTGWL